ncbi:hypothetical protein CEP51_010470 [Fusarium floridanum]|uniref:Uncharacterized protein n=1 Tax=Fusarium floridanum TaxID=1325733 RepID=A0A428RED3_9HYPO|nr:hypothetical protein CEP51_010470 [Fusarium floridanum]
MYIRELYLLFPSGHLPMIDLLLLPCSAVLRLNLMHYLDVAPEPSCSSVIPTSTIIKNTFPTHHSIISQC